MLTFEKVRSKPTVLQQLTGLTAEAFDELMPAFLQAMAYHDQRAEAGRPTPRKREPGGGRKPTLHDPADRLLFILFYFRIYPVQRVQAFFFSMSQTQVCVGPSPHTSAEYGTWRRAASSRTPSGTAPAGASPVLRAGIHH